VVCCQQCIHAVFSEGNLVRVADHQGSEPEPSVPNLVLPWQIYTEENKWDCIASSFFLDTARNIIVYLETIWKILKPGGVLINLGPLLYHFDARFYFGYGLVGFVLFDWVQCGGSVSF
jgi:hypothetical protein